MSLTPGPSPGAARRVDRGLFAFYAVVALIALAGQTGAAVEWLGWLLLFALVAVTAVELGGIVLSVYADYRRQLGERALFARSLSAAVASGGVALNWLGHADHLQGGFFAGMSALGYLVWLLHSAARRRDALRAAGKLPPTPPGYGLVQWLRHPWTTRRARTLALADPKLGLYASLAAAHSAVRVERRQAAIARLLRRKLTKGQDKLAAKIAVTVYDLDEVAARLARAADYDGLTALIAADLAPARLAVAPAETPEVPPAPPDEPSGTPPVPVPALTTVAPVPAPPVRTGTPVPRRTGTRTDAGSGTRTDDELLAVLAGVPREADGTVPVRRAAAALRTGPDRARRLLADAGLLASTPTSPVNGKVPSLVDATT